jgi:4-amino-4-deoxy-L-arabinose transferase-like glycosyltransferase
MNKGQSSLLWLLLGIWAMLLLPNLLTHGIFVDGLYYATIARNWALGDAGCLEFGLSETRMSPFYSHLPLAFWLQGFFYSLFGDQFWLGRVYSFIMFVGTAFWMQRLWALFWPNKGFYLPLLLWLMIPAVSWGATQNLLEGSLLFFAMGAVYLLAYAMERKRPWVGVLAAVFTILAFLSKGPQGLFPLAFPIIYALVFSKLNWKLWFSYYLSFVLGMLWLWSFESWRIYFGEYLEVQLMGSLELSPQEGLGRWLVLKHLLEEMLVLFIFVLMIFALGKIRKLKLFSPLDQKFYLFLLTALSASLPLMISVKQMGFYLLPAFAFFVLAFAAILDFSLLESYLKEKKFVKYLAGTLCLIAVVLMFVQYGKISRDKLIVEDVFRLDEYLEDGIEVDIANNLSADWQLLGYSANYAYLNFRLNEETLDTDYFLQQKGAEIPEGYELIELGLKGYQLSTTISKPE